MSRCLAYFITFRTYGTWLHGDGRGSVRWSADGPTFDPLPNPAIERYSKARMKSPPIVLTPEQRAVVVAAIQETSAVRGWQLFSLNVRTNHVHLVVRADNEPPEKVMNSLKSYGTRYLRAAGLAPAGAVWSRHGSTDYLWKEKDVEATMWYVVHGQDKAVGDEQQR